MTKYQPKDKSSNTKAQEVQNQLQTISQKFIDNPQEFYATKEKEIARLIARYGDLDQDMMVERKDYAMELSYYVSKPIIPYNGHVKRYTASSLLMANDFYWEKIVFPINEKMPYIPMLPDLLRMLSISTKTFNDYLTNGDEALREACTQIADQFISYYQRNGLQKNISEIMAMFVLKTTFKQRENDIVAPITNIAIVSPNEKIEAFARQKGYDIFPE